MEVNGDGDGPTTERVSVCTPRELRGPYLNFAQYVMDIAIIELFFDRRKTNGRIDSRWNRISMDRIERCFDVVGSDRRGVVIRRHRTTRHGHLSKKPPHFSICCGTTLNRISDGREMKLDVPSSALQLERHCSKRIANQRRTPTEIRTGDASIDAVRSLVSPPRLSHRENQERCKYFLLRPPIGFVVRPTEDDRPDTRRPCDVSLRISICSLKEENSDSSRRVSRRNAPNDFRMSFNERCFFFVAKSRTLPVLLFFE